MASLRIFGVVWNVLFLIWSVIWITVYAIEGKTGLAILYVGFALLFGAFLSYWIKQLRKYGVNGYTEIKR